MGLKRGKEDYSDIANGFIMNYFSRCRSDDSDFYRSEGRSSGDECSRVFFRAPAVVVGFVRRLVPSCWSYATN